MKTIFFLLFSFPVLLAAQEFSTFLYFETEEGFRDSVKIGYDPKASAGIDDQFGEIDLGESSLRDSIDIRLALPEYNNLDCFQVGEYYYDFHIPGLILQETKVDIIPKNCEQFIFDSLINRPAFFLTLLIPFSNYPLTMSWDSTVFNNACIDESFFTSWHPGSWFDSGCYGPRFISNFKGRNSYELNEPIGIQILNPDLDTLVMLFMSLESSLVVNTKEIDTISKDSPKVFPNPFTTSFTVQSEKEIKQVRVYSVDGRLELSTTKLEVQTTSLTPGIKVVEILLDDGQRYVEKLVKW